MSVIPSVIPCGSRTCIFGIRPTLVHDRVCECLWNKSRRHVTAHNISLLIGEVEASQKKLMPAKPEGEAENG